MTWKQDPEWRRGKILASCKCNDESSLQCTNAEAPTKDSVHGGMYAMCGCRCHVYARQTQAGSAEPRR